MYIYVFKKGTSDSVTIAIEEFENVVDAALRIARLYLFFIIFFYFFLFLYIRLYYEGDFFYLYRLLFLFYLNNL
jgi:hypothetical protein